MFDSKYEEEEMEKEVLTPQEEKQWSPPATGDMDMDDYTLMGFQS